MRAILDTNAVPAEEVPALKQKRQASSRIAGQGKILGDIIAPAVPAEHWSGLV